MRKVTNKVILGMILFLLICQVLILALFFIPGPERAVGMTISTGISKVTVKNDPPALTIIPDQTWQRNNQITINLNDYFYDPEGFPLTFTSSQVNDISIIINQVDGIATLIPSPDWGGIRTIYFYASDGPNMRESNKIILNVEPLLIIPPLIIRKSGGKIKEGCRYHWECQPWTRCLPENIQKRACLNKGSCPENYNAPVTIRPCVYINNKIEVIENISEDMPPKLLDEIEEEVLGKPKEEIPGKIEKDIKRVEESEAVKSRFRAPEFFLLASIFAAIGGAFFLTSEFWLPFLEKWFLLADVPDDKAFIAIDKQIAKNKKQLSDMIKKMDKKTFEHHTKGKVDDFAEWIEKVVGDKRVAKRLLKAKKTKKEYSRIIEK